MNKICVGWLLTLLLGLVPAAQAEPDESCQDSIFISTRVRIDEIPALVDKIKAWEEFVLNFAHNPCAPAARKILDKLKGSGELADEQREREEWKQEARGGVVDPELREFPLHMVFPDAPPVTRVRLTSDVIWQNDGWKENLGTARSINMDNDAIWALVLRGEAALVSHLGMSFDVPAVAASLEGDKFRWALGNMTLGLRGTWGTRLSNGTVPWVISGGFLWGSGSSLWSGASRRYLLNGAAVGAAYNRHLFAYNAPDYALHAETQVGLGDHFLGFAFTYHLYSGGERVEKIGRMDLAWDWRIMDGLETNLEINMGVGDGEAQAGSTVGNESLLFLYLSPGARVILDRYSIALAFRVPLIDASDWARLVSSLEIAARF